MSATYDISIILKALDEASAILKGASDKIQNSVGSVQKLNTDLHKSNEKVELSSKQVALAFNNIATSGFALYNAVDRVMDMQVAVDRANLAVKTSLNAVEDAQRRYNAVLDKYGPASDQAQAASADLQLAQERYQVATERASMLQGNLNEAMIQSAMTVIPSLITMISSLSTITDSWHKVQKLANQALDAIGGPVTLAIIGITALVSALIFAYEKVEWFRNGINAIGSAIYNFFVPQVVEAKRSVEDLTKALKEGTGYSQGFAEAQRQSAIFTENMKAQSTKLTSELEDNWRKQRAAADENLGAIKARFDATFNAGNFNYAVGIVRDFANQYHISMDDAHKIVDDFNATVAEIPKTIEEELIGRAQRNLETFKNCASGKFAGLNEDSSGAMKTLVQDTNDLINAGLIGQAQDNMQTFVNCATDKSAKMVSDIDAQLETATGNIRKQLLQWRLMLTWGEPGSDILEAIKLAGGKTTLPGVPEVAAPLSAVTTELEKATQAIMHLSRYEIEMARQGLGEWPELQAGGIVTRPTVALLGERGPEAIIPLGGGNFAAQPVQLTVNFHVAGALDKRTADYAVQQIQRLLKNVIIEPSSSNTFSTHKCIRLGSK